jgi:hypothetical protein
LPTEIRYLAIIQLKNGIDKYWRKTVAHAISKEEKREIRAHLYEAGIQEADPQLALQNALAISKVVRIDFPNDWPDAITSLVAIIRSAAESNPSHLRRGLVILLQVVKELSTARLARSQTSLRSVTPEMVLLLSQVYGQKTKFWLDFLAGNGSDEGGAMDAMGNSLLTLKILRRLLIIGYEYPNQVSEVRHIWSESQSQFGQLLDLISRQPPIVVTPAKEIIEKHLHQLAKLHAIMASTHPAAFALLPNSLELTRAYHGLITHYGVTYASAAPTFSGITNGDEEDRPIEEKLALKGLLILRNCLKVVFQPQHTFKYRSPEIKQEQASASAFLKTELLSDEFVCQLVDVLVTRYFVFRQADFNAWEEDPDDWEVAQDDFDSTWEFELRPCAEKLFMDLVLNFKLLLKGPLLGLFSTVAGPPQDPSSILTKDSVYTAMGLCAPAIYDDFDFDSFLTSTLVQDVQPTGPGYKLLRRRVAILIGSWVTVRISEGNRHLVYQIFQHLLNSDDQTNDPVVRMTAARQLEPVIQDVSFRVEAFQPFAADILSRLLSLIQEVERVELKLAVLSTIRIICTSLEQHVAPFADHVVSILPQIWEQSGDEHLLKQAVLVLLTTIVAAMKEESRRYYPLILPLIQQAIVPNTDIHAYLLEESLELWSGILSQAVAPAPAEVIQLADSCFPILELGDVLRTALEILESYVLLAPEAMLADGMRLRVLSYMTTLIDSNSKRELAGLVTTIVERMVRAAETLGGAQGVALITKDLIESGYAEKLLEGLHEAYEAHQTTGPNRRYPKLDDVVETDYFTVLARLALADPQTFVNLLSTAGSLENTWTYLSSEWFQHFDSMANTERQKLSCLALTSLLGLPLPTLQIFLAKLQDYFTMWTSVVGEMQDGRTDGGDNLIWQEQGGQEYDTPEEVRKRAQSAADPVHTVHTLQFINSRIHEAMEKCGGAAAFQQTWVVNVDRDIVDAFQKLSAGNGQGPP